MFSALYIYLVDVLRTRMVPCCPFPMFEKQTIREMGDCGA